MVRRAAAAHLPSAMGVVAGVGVVDSWRYAMVEEGSIDRAAAESFYVSLLPCRPLDVTVKKGSWNRRLWQALFLLRLALILSVALVCACLIIRVKGVKTDGMHGLRRGSGRRRIATIVSFLSSFKPWMRCRETYGRWHEILGGDRVKERERGWSSVVYARVCTVYS